MCWRRCPHRRTSLSLGWVEGDAIRCFYHGWKFDGARPMRRAAGRERQASPPRCQRPRLSDAGISRPDLRLSRRGRGAGISALSRARGCRGRAGRQSPPGAVQLFPARRERSRRDACPFRPSRLDRQLWPRRAARDRLSPRPITASCASARASGGGANATRTAHWMMPNVHFLDLPPSPVASALDGLSRLSRAGGRREHGDASASPSRADRARTRPGERAR